MKGQAEAYKAELNRDQQLRTHAMREADRLRRRKIYKFAVMRFRLPDGPIVQGIFAVRECVQALREFVQSVLADPSLEFQLRVPGQPALEDNQTLLEAQLAPLALIAVSLPLRTPSHAPLLRPELAERVAPLPY